MITHDAGALAALGTLALRATVVLTAAWLAARLASGRSAAVRHAVWAAGLASILALPVLTGALPTWELRVLPADSSGSPSTGVEPERTMAAAPAAPRVHHSATTATPTAALAAPTPVVAGPSTPAPSAWTPATLLPWAWVAWAVVAAALMLRYLAGIAMVARMTRRGAPAAGVRWRDEIEVAAAAVGLAREPRVVLSSEVSVPFTCGFLRPALVLPHSADTWTDERLRIVLLHELAHVARRDCLVQAVSHAACALYWFHPLAWLAARRLRAERERACDDLVLQAGTRGATYAEHLLEIARAAVRRSPRLAGAALAMARPSELEGRLLAILDGRRDRGRSRRTVSWQLLILGAVVLLPSATVRLVARDAAAAVMPAPEAAPQSASDAAAQGATATTTQTVAVTHESPHGRGAGVGHGIGDGVAEGVAGGVTRGVVAGVASGVAEGIAGGVAGGVGQTVVAALAGSDDDEQKTLPPAVLQGLTEALKDSDAEVRKQALRALARFHSPEAYEAFSTALKDSDPEIRQQAVFALAHLHDARAVQPLTGMLRDGDADVRQQAAFGLGQLRAKEAVQPLIGLLHDPNDDVREQTIFALGQIGDSSAASAIAGALTDKADDVRQQAAFALGQFGDPGGVPGLVVALADKAPEVRQQAAFALGQIGDDRALDALTAALKDPNAEVREQAIFAISQIAGGGRHHPRAIQPPPPAAAAPAVAPTPRPAGTPVPPPPQPR